MYMYVCFSITVKKGSYIHIHIYTTPTSTCLLERRHHALDAALDFVARQPPPKRGPGLDALRDALAGLGERERQWRRGYQSASAAEIETKIKPNTRTQDPPFFLPDVHIYHGTIYIS